MVQLFPAERDYCFDTSNGVLDCQFVCVEDDNGIPLGLGRREEYGRLQLTSRPDCFKPVNIYSPNDIRSERDKWKRETKIQFIDLMDASSILYVYTPIIGVAVGMIYWFFNHN